MQADVSSGTWSPHVTVATVIPRNNTFLMVREFDGERTVINQPAGHLEADESLIEAAQREVLEETGWKVSIPYFLGASLYKAPNGITYLRHSFVGRAIECLENPTLDTGILEAVWLKTDEIEAAADLLRSPLVLNDIKRYKNGQYWPTEDVYTSEV